MTETVSFLSPSETVVAGPREDGWGGVWFVVGQSDGSTSLRKWEGQSLHVVKGYVPVATAAEMTAAQLTAAQFALAA